MSRGRRSTSAEAAARPFREVLSALLTERGLSQADLARLSGCQRSTLSRILSGERSPTAAVIAQLAGALVIERHALVAGTDAADVAPHGHPELEQAATLRAQLFEAVSELGQERAAHAATRREITALRATLARIARLAGGGREAVAAEG